MPKVLVAAEKLRGQYADSTLKSFVEIMGTLNRYCDIDNAAEVLSYIERQVPKAKKNYWEFYKIYAKFYGIPLPSARFRKNRSIPFVPVEEMLEDIIKAVKKPEAKASLRILKATGCRIGELKQLRLDPSRRAAIILCEKKRGENKERIVPVPDEVLAIKSWETKPKKIQKVVRYAVKKLAEITGNNDYLKIHPHSFRHWFATQVYSKTQDLMLVKELLGHERLEELTVYVHIVKLSNPKKDAVKIHVSEVDKAVELVKQGWKFVTQLGEWSIWEKPTFP